MIIQEQGDHLIVIRQTDHAVLSGYFAREAGNENFARPEPLESFQLAATEHDNGWNEWKLNRRMDPSTSCRKSFLSCQTRDHTNPYHRAFEGLEKVNV